MIALMTTADNPLALEPDFIESVEADPDNGERCRVQMASGKLHHIARSYTYVTGILRAHLERHDN